MLNGFIFQALWCQETWLGGKINWFQRSFASHRRNKQNEQTWWNPKMDFSSLWSTCSGWNIRVQNWVDDEFNIMVSQIYSEQLSSFQAKFEILIYPDIFFLWQKLLAHQSIIRIQVIKLKLIILQFEYFCITNCFKWQSFSQSTETKYYLFKWRIFSKTSTEQSDKNKKNLDFSYWAWSTPWGHVLML